MNHVLNNDKVSCFTQKHSVAKLLPIGQLMNVLPRLKFLNAITALTPLTVFLIPLQPTKSIYMEPVQGLNLNRRYISGLEPEMPVTLYVVIYRRISLLHLKHCNFQLRAYFL
jgi:hypothetical protein